MSIIDVPTVIIGHGVIRINEYNNKILDLDRTHPLYPLDIIGCEWYVKDYSDDAMFIEVTPVDGIQTVRYVSNTNDEIKIKFLGVSAETHYSNLKSNAADFAYSNWDQMLKEKPDWPGDPPEVPEMPDTNDTKAMEDYQKQIEDISQKQKDYADKIDKASKKFMAKLILRLLSHFSNRL